MEPRGCNRWQSVANHDRRRPAKQAKSVAVGCHRLPEKFHGKEGVCRGLPPVAGVPLLRRRGSIPTWIRERDYFLAQSGHGHWSHPQPVHAWQIMRASYLQLIPVSGLQLRSSAEERCGE
jgi:hypothetical protein